MLGNWARRSLRISAGPGVLLSLDRRGRLVRNESWKPSGRWYRRIESWNGDITRIQFLEEWTNTVPFWLVSRDGHQNEIL